MRELADRRALADHDDQRAPIAAHLDIGEQAGAEYGADRLGNALASSSSPMLTGR
jgi:hypothetical protein